MPPKVPSAIDISAALRRDRARRAALRRKFLLKIGSIEPFQQMFHPLPGVHFCVKDAQSRLIQGNNALYQRLAIATATWREPERALPHTLHEVLQVISISAREKSPLAELFAKLDTAMLRFGIPMQLEMTGFCSGSRGASAIL